MDIPTKLSLNQQKNMLKISYGDTHYSLTSEYLRVYSTSAEVIGHGPGQETLQLNKQDVTIDNIVQRGNYAVLIIFSDGHDSGIYSWNTLKKLSINYAENWQNYLDRCAEHNAQLDKNISELI